MDSLSLLGANLLSPPVIAFATGIVAVWVRSDLKFPDQVYQVLTIYLLLAIGFKGGSALADASFSQLAMPLLATLAIGSLIPVGVFYALRLTMRMNISNSAAMAAHYGSVSAVTFMACLAFLDNQSVTYEKFMPAVMAVMEIPAIFVAILLAKILKKDSNLSIGASIHEVLSGKSFILLGCGLFAGGVCSEHARELVNPFLVTPFFGVLMLFLLEMGLVAGEKVKDAGKIGFSLALFAIIAPIINGTIGIFIGFVIGLSQGGSVIFAILTASASYIAAPAAVRIALPEANPGIYVTASLGITFPFNLVFGIPLYFSISQWVF